MDWDKLKIFHAVAEAGSFTNATINLNLSQSAISRQIQSLEQDLKVQLFERHARGLTLTENGEYVFKTAHEVISKLKEVETSLGDQKNKPTGKLTITTVRSFGTHWLTPRIEEFMRLNPEVEIELIFEDKELDLSTRQADIGIFMRRPKQLNLIQKKSVTIIGYGSQGHAHALNLRDSGVKVCIGLRPNGSSWKKAEAEGFEVKSIEESVKDADVIMYLLPDENISDTYNQTEPNIKNGSSLIF